MMNICYKHINFNLIFKIKNHNNNNNNNNDNLYYK